MRYKSLISILVFLFGLGLSLVLPAQALAAQVTNICGISPTYDGMTGGPACEGPCWSNNGSEGRCSDPGIGGYDTYIDVQACDTDSGNHNQCDGSTGGYGISNYNAGGTVSSNSYIGGHCKIQLDTYKDNGSGRQLIGFLTVREPGNCNPPATAKYRCSGNSCIRDDAGGWTTDSNCAGACAPPPPQVCYIEAQNRVPSIPALSSWGRRNLAVTAGTPVEFRSLPDNSNDPGGSSLYGSAPNGSGTPRGPFGYYWSGVAGVNYPIESVANFLITAFPYGGPPNCKDSFRINISPTPTPIPVCTNTTPTGLANSETVSGTTATLSWSLGSWGTNCAGNVNRYQVYVDGALATTQTTSSLTSLYSYTGAAGSHLWYVVASNGAATATSPTRPFSFTAPSSSWFQVRGGDVVAATGDITVSDGVPAGKKFLESPDAIVIYSGTTTGITPAQVNGWQVNSAVSSSVITANSYDRFKARIGNRVVPDPLIPGSLSACTAKSDGACYLISSGNVSIPTQDIGSKKVVVLVEGTATIDGTVTFTDGSGLLVILAKNDIVVNPAVTALKGIFLAGGIFNTGSGPSQLQVDGTVVGLSGVTLGRSFASDTQPAEKFVYHPEYISALPATLYEQNRQSEELAP